MSDDTYADGTPVPDEPPYVVYECWVANDSNSFNKLNSDDSFGVAVWLMNALQTLPMHGHINIVKHSSDEYTYSRGTERTVETDLREDR